MSELSLLCDIHKDVALPEDYEEAGLVRGKYEYFHYIVDGFDDRGWGCGYRTLQTLCSWVRYALLENKQLIPKVPSLREIQEVLVQTGDKPPTFIGSRGWIGSYEACLCLDQTYDVCSKILHVQSGREVLGKADEILKHFIQFGSPVMIGGDADASSKTLLGVCRTTCRQYLFLISDPHFLGVADVKTLQDGGWLKWKKTDEVFQENSFYNFCLPQLRYGTNNEYKHKLLKS